LHPRTTGDTLFLDHRLDARLDGVQRVKSHGAGEAADGASQRFYKDLLIVGQRA
jgi:hypothetical protein